MATGYSAWNRTPGTQSASWEVPSPNTLSNVDDMWSNSSSNTRKPWPDSADSSNWNNSSSFGGPSVVSTSDTMGVWGGNQIVSPASSIGGPSRNSNRNNPWSENSKELLLENIRSSGEAQPISSASQIPATNLAKKDLRSGPSLSDLNAMLNTLNNNNALLISNGSNPELDDVVKAIINVNDAWGQRSVDQSQPWDTSSIPVATEETSTGSPTSGSNSNLASGMINHGQMNMFSGSQGRSRMKPGPSGSMESNVWSHEPPNGTGIWEAHYENLGERTAHWQQAAAATNVGHNNGQFPMPSNSTQKVPSFNRQQAAASSSAITAAPWDQQSNMMMMDLNQGAVPPRWNTPAASIDVNMPNSMLSRPLNKGGMLSGGGGGQRWSNGQAPQMDSGYVGGHPFGAPGVNQWAGNRMNMNKFSNQTNVWQQTSTSDYPNSMMQPPPIHPASTGGPRIMHGGVPPGGNQYQGHVRQNITRQLQNLGVPIEEITQALQRNNMDIEKALSELRDKLGLPLDGILNPLTGFSNQQMYSYDGGAVTPSDMMGQQDYNRMPAATQAMSDRNRYVVMMNSGQPSPTNPSPAISNEIASLYQRENQVTSSISMLRKKLQELNAQFNALNNSGSGNSAPCHEIQQQMIMVNKQLHGLNGQLTSIRSQLNMYKSGAGSASGSAGRPISGAASNPGASLDMMTETQRMMSELRLNQSVGSGGLHGAHSGLWGASSAGATKNPPGQRFWNILKDIPPPAASVDIIKLALDTAHVVNFELHPNMSARWCLIGLSNQADALNLVRYFQPEQARIGKMEHLTPAEAMTFMQEIQNLSRNSGFSQPGGGGARWMQQHDSSNHHHKNLGLLETVPPNAIDIGADQQEETMPPGIVEQLEETATGSTGQPDDA